MAPDLQVPAQAAAQSAAQQPAPSAAIAPAGQPEVQTAGIQPSSALIAPPPVHPLTAGTAASSLAALQAAPAKPGNYARSVLTGLLTTMSKLGGGAANTMAGLSQTGGGIFNTLGIMAGSKPGQEYNNIQAAKVARQKQQQDQQAFDLNQHLNHSRLAYSDFQLRNAQDEANRDSETFGQNEVKNYEQNNGRLIKGDMLADESAKYFGQKVDGQPVEIIRTGSRIIGYDSSGQEIKKPTYSAIVAGPGGIPLSKEDIDTISKYDPQFKDAVPGQLINASTRRDMLQKAQAADLVQDKINQSLAATNLDVAKTKNEETKQTDVKTQQDSLNYLASVMAQTKNPDPLAAYQTIVREQAQVDPKTGQPTPTAIKAHQMLPGVMTSLKGPDGIVALETNRDKALHEAATADGKETPQQKLSWKQVTVATDARSKALDEWNKAKAALAGESDDPALKAKADAAYGNFQALDKDYEKAVSNYQGLIGSAKTAKAGQAQSQNMLPAAPTKGTTLHDRNIWNQFLSAANGDPVKAEQLATSKGWK